MTRKRFTSPHAVTLGDPVMEQVRRSHHDAIRELQQDIRGLGVALAPRRYVPATLGYSAATSRYISTSNDPGAFWGSSNSQSHRVEVPLTQLFEPGQQIQTIALRIREGNVAGETVQGFLYRIDEFGVLTHAITVKTSDTGGADTTMRWNASDGLPLIIRSDMSYIFVVLLAQTSSNNEGRFYNVLFNESS